MFAILNQTEAGKVIIRGFQEREEAFITSLERQEVVRICVQHLISLPSQYYPSAVIKERMAEAIVTAFPCLAYKAEGSKPYAHFYNPDLPGFLDQRLKTIRKALQPNDRKRKVSSPQHTPRQSNKRKGALLSTKLDDENMLMQQKYEVNGTFTL